MPRPVKDQEIKIRLNKKYTRVRGVKDVLFDEGKYWELVEKKITNLANVYGYNRIKIPTIDRYDLFKESIGEDTNIISKELYTFVDKGGDKVTLRPDSNPGVIRSYLEHGLFNAHTPIKTFWMGDLFKYTKLQQGNLRQFSQFNFSILGEKNPFADIQLILIAYNFFKELQIDVQVQINSIGCKECQPEYVKELIEFYKERGKRSKLCNDCKKRFSKNPIHLLGCLEEDCVTVREDMPQIVDFLCDNCRDHLIKILEYLDELEIPYNLNPALVRGEDYYNKTVFEIVSVEEEADDEKSKKQVVFGGGGRYNSVIEKLGGLDTPACGFGVEIEKVVAKIKEKNIPLKDATDYIFLAQLGDQARRESFLLFEELRRAGYNIRQALTEDTLKAQLAEAKKLDVKFTLILGQKEIIDNTIIIRDMESGNQEVIDYKKIQSELNKRLDKGEGKE